MTALYILGAFLVLLLAGVVLAPLVEREPPDEELEEMPPDERREAAVDALAEVEFEYRTDKLSEEEYRRLRTRYGRIALAAEEEMEDGGREPGGESPSPDDDRGAAAESGRPEEAAVAPGSDATDAAQTSAGAARSGSAGAGPSRSCPECGATAPEGATFCPRCGARQQDEPEEA